MRLANLETSKLSLDWKLMGKFAVSPDELDAIEELKRVQCMEQLVLSGQFDAALEMAVTPAEEGKIKDASTSEAKLDEWKAEAKAAAEARMEQAVERGSLMSDDGWLMSGSGEWRWLADERWRRGEGVVATLGGSKPVEECRRKSG